MSDPVAAVTEAEATRETAAIFADICAVEGRGCIVWYGGVPRPSRHRARSGRGRDMRRRDPWLPVPNPSGASDRANDHCLRPCSPRRADPPWPAIGAGHGLPEAQEAAKTGGLPIKRAWVNGWLTHI